MTEDFKDLKRRKKNTSKIATYCLIASMGIMALWGWTPLKQIIPGAAVLFLFFVLMVVSMGATVLGIYRGIQIKHEKAKAEDS